MIGKLINLARVEAAAFADALDGLEAGMFLVDAGGRLVHANASGRAMLKEGNVLHANGKLVALDCSPPATAIRRSERRTSRCA